MKTTEEDEVYHYGAHRVAGLSFCSYSYNLI